MREQYAMLFKAPDTLNADLARADVWLALQKKNEDAQKNLLETEKAMIQIDIVDHKTIALRVSYNFSCTLCRKIRGKLAKYGYEHLATLSAEKVERDWVYPYKQVAAS